MLDSVRFSGVRLLENSTSTLVRVNPKYRPKRTVLGQVLNYQISNQLHNPTHARVVHLKMLGQLRHGVGAGGKGGLNCGVAVVAVVGVLAFKRIQRRWLRPALDVRNVPARAAHACP